VTALETALRQIAAALVQANAVFASSGIEPEVVAEAEPVELLRGLTMHVACVGHLLALKIRSRDDVSRPQDIATCERSSGSRRLPSCNALASPWTLITARGYHRGRNLTEELDKLVGSRP
jgi:hypothetical protein